MGRKLRAISRTIRWRSGEAKAEVLALTEQTGELLERSVREARKLAAAARFKARGRGARAKLNAATTLEELADRCEKVARQIRRRVKGEPITDRLVSLADPDARPIRKGKLGKPNEFGYVAPDRGGNREHPARGAGSDPAGGQRAGQPAREHAAARHRLRVQTARDLTAGGRAGRRLSARADRGRVRGDPARECSSLAARNPAPDTPSGACGATETGAEGRISHLKRRYGLDRSRLKGDQGQQIWTEWGILACNADTRAVRTR